MSEESTIRDFQTVLQKFKFRQPQSFSESFAIARFKKKFEEPNQDTASTLASECWNNWLDFDNGLREIQLPPGAWYKARELLHRELVPIRFNQVHFPQGSEFEPTRGYNSIEARLCESRWTCTAANFDRMASICYRHKALKRAVRNRYTNWFNRRGFDISQSAADRLLYTRLSQGGCKEGVGLRIFSWKLRNLCVITYGSRFSTVPKNNVARRPINVEPFGNTITQRAVGEHLRAEINRIFSVDLDTLSDSHRERIRYVNDIATIDLKNASDSVSWSLCNFLLPKHIMKVLDESRSHFVLGPDGHYHQTKKISSMGNGFTFELMSMILLALCRVYDDTATVFGDDIIIARNHAPQLISDLEAVGFVVNTDKSFIDGPFRESCGANFHLDEGYVESYDFTWPESIGDCVIIWNKIRRLKNIYPSFKPLHDSLYRSLPNVLRGGPDPAFERRNMLELVGLGWDSDVPVVFPLFFVTDKIGGKELSEKIGVALKHIHYDPDDFRLVQGFMFVNDLRSPTVKHLNSSRHWAKYEMYLHGNRRTNDSIKDRGKWTTVWFVNSGTEHFRARSLMT